MDRDANSGTFAVSNITFTGVFYPIYERVPIIEVGFFGAIGVMFDTNGVANLIKKFFQRQHSVIFSRESVIIRSIEINY